MATESSTPDSPPAAEPWRDPARTPAERVADLLGRMTLEEKAAQLYSVWIGIPGSSDHTADQAGDGAVAPMQHEFLDTDVNWQRLIRLGLGQLTRPFGTAPVDSATGAQALAKLQAEITAAGRFGIPAIAHEECLTGVLALGATIYPTPLAWGATFDPDLAHRMGAQIGVSMRGVGIHQGLGPVLDVTRDPRWGRTEETIGEDPYLVATIGTAYVRGMESAGIITTLKHFAGYSGSRAGRNFAPVTVGPRELHEVFLTPFELAVREGGARSVMHSYAEIDGVPAAADPELLTEILRREWGFDGTVVSDYFGIGFLEELHHIAGSKAEAAALALRAGVDVELPAVRCYGEPLVEAIRAGAVPESLVDRAAARVLRQKCDLGLLDPGWTPVPTAPAAGLDPPSARAHALRVARESVILLRNDEVLPLPAAAKVAVVGPLADDPEGMLGCYTFPRHVGGPGPAIPSVLAALREAMPSATFTHAAGCAVGGPGAGNQSGAVPSASAPWPAADHGTGERAEIDAALALTRDADICVAVLGDRAGLFGKGTSGEGCDATDLRLPGAQGDLLDALLTTGTPVIVVLLTGRPYALGAYAERVAGLVQAFFPGQEGGRAVADVLSGRISPSGRLPVSMPRDPGGQPSTYLAPALGHRNEVSTIDPTPLYPFGFGLSYTSFEWSDVAVSAPECGVDGAVAVSVTVRNTGSVSGADVVQLYLSDPVAQVTRPVVRLVGYAKVGLEPGESRRVTFTVHADVTAFVGRGGRWVVEPGDIELCLGASCQDIRHRLRVRLTGQERAVGHDREMTTQVDYSS